MTNTVEWTILRSDGGTEKRVSTNLRTNAGAGWQADLMGAATSALTAIRNISLSSDTATPVSTNTNLASEFTTVGLSRTTSTYTYTASASTYTLSATWVTSGAAVVTKAAIAFAATDTDLSTDTHFCITLLSSPATLASGDTLSIAWGIGF